MTTELLWRPSARVSLVVTRRFALVVPLLALMLLGMGALALGVGSSPIVAADLWAALTQPFDGLGEDARTAATFRIPRLIGGALCGALVAASGVLLQVVSRNGLADAGVLGISEGAVAAVVLTLLLVGPLPREVVGLVSVAGSFGTGLAVIVLGRRLGTAGGFILIGLALNILLGALVEMVVIGGGIEQFATLLVWSRGSLATISRGDMAFLLWTSVPLVTLLLCLSRHLALFALGDEQARAMGHDTQRLARVFILLAAASLAPVVATAGPVAFLGLMSAYLARRLVGDRPAEVLVVAMLCGAVLLVLADTAGRSLFAPIIVTAGILVSVVGVPAFLIAARMGRQPR